MRISSLALILTMSVISFAKAESVPVIAEIGADKLCPFIPAPNANTADMINAINTQLNKFKEACPGGAASIKSVDSGPIQVVMLTRDATSGPSQLYSTSDTPSVSTNGLQLDCMNFPSLLEAEMQNAMVNPSSASRYSECSSEPNPQSCIIRIYSRDKSMMTNTCHKTAVTKFNSNMLSALQDASHTISNAIANSSICNQTGSQVATEVLQRTGGEVLDSISSIGPAFGLPGLALSLGANIAEGILRKNAVDGTADSYLHKIEAENKFPEMACLWLKMQDNIVKCTPPQKNVDKEVGYEPPLCLGYLVGLPDQSSVHELLNYFSDMKIANESEENKHNINLNNPNDKEKNSRANAFDDELIASFNEKLDMKIADPVRGQGDPIVVKDHLLQILDTLGAEKKDERVKTQVRSLRTLLGLNDQILASDDEAKSRKLKMEFRDTMRNFDFSKLINSYWKKQNPDEALSVTELLGIQMQLSSFASPRGQSNGRSLTTPANAMIGIFKNKFNQRLELAAGRYEAAVNQIRKSSNPAGAQISINEMKTAATDLTKICSLLGGMYNSPSDLNDLINPLTQVKGSNNSTYSSACEKVKCLKTSNNQSIVMPQALKSDEFQQYQCTNKMDYTQIVKGLNDKLQKVDIQNPELCPSRSMSF